MLPKMRQIILGIKSVPTLLTIVVFTSSLHLQYCKCLQHIPWDPSLRELRADAYMGQGNVVHAISDIRSVTRLTSGMGNRIL